MYESSVADAVSHFTAHGYTGGLRAEKGELRDVVMGLTDRSEQVRRWIDSMRKPSAG